MPRKAIIDGTDVVRICALVSVYAALRCKKHTEFTHDTRFQKDYLHYVHSVWKGAQMLADDVVEDVRRNALFFRNIDAWTHGALLSCGERRTYELNRQGAKASGDGICGICCNTRARLHSAIYPSSTELSFASMRDAVCGGPLSAWRTIPYGYPASAMRSRFCARVGNRECSQAGSVWEKTVKVIGPVHIRAREVQLSALDKMWSSLWRERFIVLAHVRAVAAAAWNA